MVTFNSNYTLEEATIAIERDTEQVPVAKKRKNDGIIARLRSRLHQKILSTFHPSAKSKEVHTTTKTHQVPQVLFAPAVQSRLEEPSRNGARMCSLRSILEHSALSTPISRMITPPPPIVYDLPSADEAQTSGNTSSAESILSWDRAGRRNYEEDVSSMSICSQDSIAAETTSLSECSYRLDDTITMCRTMSEPLLNCIGEDIAYVDVNLRRDRAITPVDRKELNQFMFRTKSR